MTERKVKTTERIYEKDSSVKKFEGTVLSCEKSGENYRVILDKTAFFPTGGGQSCDSGTLGGIPVSDVFVESGEIIHVLSAPLEEGKTAVGELNYAEREEKMRSHTAEHILSALLHKKYGLINVGFHLGSVDTTCDFNGYLSESELEEAENEVNRTIRENHTVYAEFPSENELKSLEYRSKLDLSEDVRIVVIGENGIIDRCACCAPHVTFTGNIGLFKITDSYRYKGGTRVHILTGEKALKQSRSDANGIKAVSVLLSAKPNDTDVTSAVLRLSEENKALKAALDSANDRISSLICASVPIGEQAVVFDERADTSVLRKLALSAQSRAKTVAVFGGSDGDYRLVICGERHNELFSKLKDRLNTRGGGKEIICGSIFADREEIEKLLSPTAKTLL